MDLTILFGACVKTVRTTNKLLGGKDVKANILRNSRKDPHLQLPKEIVKQISELHRFFKEHKLAYLNVVNCLSTNKTMTELDRLEIDTKAQKIINACSTLISDYRKQIAGIKKSEQAEEHYTSVINSLEAYLREVSKSYTEAKAIRVKKVIDMHKISKLETVPSKTPQENKKPLKIPQTSPAAKIEQELSPEELQMFESENDMLYNELNSLSDEVKQMESKVVHIAELQELFSEKVLLQEKDIDRIANVVAATTDDMKNANEQIRQAIQRNAGLRVYVLFFLLVMSLSLLFLDWYND